MMKTPKRQTPTYATKERKREREKQALAGRLQRRWFYLSPRKTEREKKREKKTENKNVY
jgi:hypothetical protein